MNKLQRVLKLGDCSVGVEPQDAAECVRPPNATPDQIALPIAHLSDPLRFGQPRLGPKQLRTQPLQLIARIRTGKRL